MNIKTKLRKPIMMLVSAGLTGMSALAIADSQAPSLIMSKRANQADQIRMIAPKQPVSITRQDKRPMSESIANQFAPRFGIQNPASQLKVKKQNIRSHATSIRYQQQQNGVPVFAGELIANINNQQQLISMNGEVSSTSVANTHPDISAEQARLTAINATSRRYNIAEHNLNVTQPELVIYDPGLIYNSPSAPQLVWKMNVTPLDDSAINQVVFVNAHVGGVVLSFNKVDNVLGRRIFDTGLLGPTDPLPVIPDCSEANDPCTGAHQDVLDAYNFIGDTYNFFLTQHGRNGIDPADSPITALVRFPASSPSAFYSGTGALPGESNLMGFSVGMATDDVVAHEYTHGVTENESNLIYLSESGAINESFSDIWGELVDQTNGSADDTPTNKWDIGEGSTLGVIRKMDDPTDFPAPVTPLSPDLRQPDRIGSPFFYIGTADNGGVHINSGVNNKAAYLMVEGSAAENDPVAGQFNGQVVAGMGMDKTLALYYEVQVNYLTTGSDFLDLNNALLAACDAFATNGTSGFVPADCTDTVQPALAAVEMDQTPTIAYAPTAPICSTGNVYDLFTDDFEGPAINLSKWNSSTLFGTNTWQNSTVNLGTNSGTYSLTANGYIASPPDVTDASPNNDLSNDAVLAMRNAVRVPISLPAYIHFDQAFYFIQGEDLSGSLFNIDGGVLEYSVDGGTTWQDAGDLIDQGRSYTGNLSHYTKDGAGTLSLSSRSGFVKFSNGFNSTRLNLSSLAGELVQLRFRNLAISNASGPWTIDNYRFYICADNAPPIPNAGADQSVNGDDVVQLSGSINDLDGDSITFSWNQVSGDPVILTNPNSLNPTFTAPRNNSTIVFELIANDGNYTETDSTNVTITFVNNSGGGGGGCSLSNHGRFDPIWLLLLGIFSLIHLRQRKRVKAQ